MRSAITLLALFAFALLGMTYAAEPEIPVSDALFPVTIPAVASKTYDKVYPVLLVFRYVDTGEGDYRPILQRLTVAPAVINGDGTMDVLMDPEKHLTVTDVDVRKERGRSPVLKAALDTFVSTLTMMATERKLRQAIEARYIADPEADLSAQQAILANLRGALEITESPSASRK